MCLSDVSAVCAGSREEQGGAVPEEMACRAAAGRRRRARRASATTARALSIRPAHSHTPPRAAPPRNEHTPGAPLNPHSPIRAPRLDDPLCIKPTACERVSVFSFARPCFSRAHARGLLPPLPPLPSDAAAPLAGAPPPTRERLLEIHPRRSRPPFPFSVARAPSRRHGRRRRRRRQWRL
jgi:hypothetical protein